MLKAGREAKVHSSWVNPDAGHEEATRDFVHALLAPDPGNLFLRDFLPFQERVARIGAFNALAQLLLKPASTGVPDIYQGNELWDFSLVDPDNRRSVDYAARREALRGIEAMHAEQGAGGCGCGCGCAQSLLDTLADGRIKLYLTWKTLVFRRECEQLFRDGDDLPLKTHGVCAEQVCAFARQFGGGTMMVMVPRLLCSLVGEEGSLAVGAGIWATPGSNCRRSACTRSGAKC
jgi:(1->4)-alpha-D-glucan 1-alpha-D-glucosylmutase